MNKKICLLLSIIALASIAAYGADWVPPELTITQPIQDVIDLLITFICMPACIIVYLSTSLAALFLILGGARYIAADDPGTRAGLRRFMVGVIVGLVIIVLAIPLMNYLVEDILGGVACTCFEGDEGAIRTVLCNNLIGALLTLGPWICALMVIYGGLRYLSSTDDPGIRKSAKNTIIAAFVGMVIIMLSIPLVNMVIGDSLDVDEVKCDPLDGEMTDQITSVLGNFLCILALIAPPICALVVTYGGLRYITSADDPRARDAAKTTIISALIGMILVMLAVPLVNVVLTETFEQVPFDCTQGDIGTEIGDIMLNFICFISLIAPAVCALVVIYGGLRYLASGEDPGARRTAKTIIISALVGMVLVFIAVPVVNLVLIEGFGQVGYTCSESDSVAQVVEILCKFICLIASVSPAIAALVFLMGGLRYITSAEDPGARKAAKDIIIGSIVGLILVMISLALVNLVVSGWTDEVRCACFDVSDPLEQITTIFCTLACTIQSLAPPIAVLVIAYGGLKYMTSTDDAGARATAKSIVINAVIGLIIVMISLELVNLVLENLMPTFICDCVEVLPGLFSLAGAETADPEDSKLHVLSSDAICTNCCRENVDTECYYSYNSGGNTQYGGYSSSTGQKITKCETPSGSGDYTVEWDEAGSLITYHPKPGAKCSTKSEAMPCTSAADAPAKGPTFMYDAVKKDCVDKCAGQTCCQTTDAAGRPGCIGTNTPNQVKLNSCSLDDFLTHYTCNAAGECIATETGCANNCRNGACTGTSPDPGDLDVTNPEII